MLINTICIKGMLDCLNNIHIIEIGVYRAENAKLCLENLDIKEYILIDPYTVLDYIPERYGTKKIVKKNRKIAHKSLEKYEKKEKPLLIWIEETSENASKKLKDNNFDVVYIDGDHNYEFVLSDIENYIPKLKKGGLIIGDDYYDPNWYNYIEKNNLKSGRGVPDVSRAVKKYCLENNQKFYIDYPPKKELGGTLKWWWIVK